MKLKEQIDDFYALAARQAGKKEALEEQLRAADTEIESIDSRRQRMKEAGDLLQLVADRLQEAGITKVEAFVTECIRYVYDDGSYTFAIDFPFLRGRYEARYYITQVRGTRRIRVEVATGHGWGLTEVADFFLRVGVVAAIPGIARIVISDDPVSHLPPERARRVGELIKAIGPEIQFLFTSTDPVLVEAAADKVHEIVSLGDGSSGLKES